MPRPRLWSPADPYLYDLKVALVRNGTVVDEASSYFGLRKISLGPGPDGAARLLLNGTPLFQFGFLDQGFWPDGLHTPPTDEAMRFDIASTLGFGMNLARKHIKIEPDRWYHWADKLGLLVWQDMPSGGNDTPVARANFASEWQRLIDARYNHPCFVMWVPFNEGWGQPDADGTRAVAEWTAEYDPTRLVNNTSGWADAGAGHIADVHHIDLYIKGDLPLQNNAGGQGVAADIFDGIDLDWEYPVSGGDVGTHHNIDDSTNFNLLLAEFRKQFNAIGRDDLLLTMAAPGSEYNSQDFHISDAHPYLDYIQLMTYDFSGDWNSTTGHLANLCKSSADPASAEWRLSMDKAVRVYRDRYGVPARKILPGAAFYGRGWTGVSNTDSGLYQSKSGPAPGTYEQGYELYRDLVPKLTSGYTIYWDNLAEAGWIYSSTDKIFWTFMNQMLYP